MHRFISNYIILPDARVLHNHIVCFDDGRLFELHPFSGELAYTIYVPNPIIIISKDIVSRVKSIFEDSFDMPEFCILLSQCRFSHGLKLGDSVVALELDFCQRYISELC